MLFTFVALQLFSPSAYSFSDSVNVIKKKNLEITEIYDLTNNCRLKSRTTIKMKTQLDRVVTIVEWDEKGKKRVEITKKIHRSRRGFPSLIITKSTVIRWDGAGKKSKEEKVYSESNF